MYDWKKQKFVEDKMDEYLSHDNTTDIASDPAYQQYRSQYLDLGKQMTDYTGNMVDSMTGSYGNDYSKLVNQQAYQQYVGAINDLNPQFESVAASKRSAELQQLLNQMSLSRSMTDQGVVKASGKELDSLGELPDEYADLELGWWESLKDIGVLSEKEWEKAWRTDEAYRYGVDGEPINTYSEYAADELKEAVRSGLWKPENTLLINPSLLKTYLDRNKTTLTAKDRRYNK